MKQMKEGVRDSVKNSEKEKVEVEILRIYHERREKGRGRK